jgi:hypothetical protein
MVRVAGASISPCPRRGQGGASLLEVMIALLLLGLVAMGIIGGFLTTAQVSESITGTTGADAVLSRAVERVRLMPYAPCDAHGGPTPSDLTSRYLASDPHLPSGAQVRITSVGFWDGTTFVGSCSHDRGAQLLTVEALVHGGHGVHGQVVVRDPQARPS